MIERYTLPEMKRIWSVENRFKVMLEVEVLACEVWQRWPDSQSRQDYQRKANFNVERISEIEAVTRHDVIAFLTNVAEYVGKRLNISIWA